MTEPHSINRGKKQATQWGKIFIAFQIIILGRQRGWDRPSPTDNAPIIFIWKAIFIFGVPGTLFVYAKNIHYKFYDVNFNRILLFIIFTLRNQYKNDHIIKVFIKGLSISLALKFKGP